MMCFGLASERNQCCRGSHSFVFLALRARKSFLWLCSSLLEDYHCTCRWEMEKRYGLLCLEVAYEAR